MSNWAGEQGKARKSASAALVASLMSVVVTLLGVVITEASGLNEAKYVLPLAYTGLCVALVVLAGIYIAAHVGDLQAERRELHFGNLVNRAIPKLVSFERRQDILIIKADGSAELEWHFELTAPRKEAISELTFPIYGEVESVEKWREFVFLDSVEVNGEEHNGVLEQRELRKSLKEGHPSLLYSLLRVPVDLGKGKESCSLRVRLRLEGIFLRINDWEAFYVDIPYLTESLEVTIRPESGRVQQPLRDGGVIEAMSGLMEVPDAEESASQAKHCSQVHNALVWKTHTPKLGYRYQVRFQWIGPRAEAGTE